MELLTSIGIYVLIFIAKMVEVSMATVRNVLNNRGEKLKGAAIGFFEVLIWLMVVSNVLDTITHDPFKVVVYCLAFSAGNYLGITIENKLAIGTSNIMAIIPEDKREDLTKALRERGFGVTVVEGQGMEQTVDMLMIYLKRKCVPEAVELIRQYSPNAMITVNDVRQLRNGFIRK